MSRSRQSGFTLVELMIALVAGAFAVSAVYYLNGVSSRSFSEQMRVSETQMSLRSAMEQLRRDFARAGYLATPSTDVAPGCSGAAGAGSLVSDRTMRAVAIAYDGSNVAGSDTSKLLLAPGTNATRADVVDTWGNYATPDAYLVDPNNTTGTVIRFQTASESFRRSFYRPVTGNAAATWDAARFERVFAKNRMVRVEHNGRFFFRDIIDFSSAVASPSITISALPSCFEPTGWSAVTPLVHYRYSVEADTAADLGRLKTATANKLIGSRRTMLVRREIRDKTSTTVPEANTSHLLLDYAVEFSVDAVVNTAATLTARPRWGFSRNADVNTAASERIRSLLVTLTARSAEADPRLPAMPRTTFNNAATWNTPLMMFRVTDPDSPTVVMNARVRTLRSEIYLQNM
jgi:prepilin-type N-terminal cleavage/methylation domain-containing protein